MRERKSLVSWTVRFPPCPAYDIEGTESWLQDMAAEGYFLKKFTLGLAVFEKSQPRRVRYRLDAAETAKTIDTTTPPRDVQDSYEMFGWQFVTRRVEFFIYISEDSSDRELNTDPKVQALAIDLVRKRMLCHTWNLFLIWFLLPFLQGELPTIWIAMVIGSPLYALGLVLFLWAGIITLYKFFHLRKVRKQLASGIPLRHKKDWKKHPKRRGIGIVTFTLLLCVFVAGFAHAAMTEQDQYVPITEYDEDLPFATLKDLMPGSVEEPFVSISGSNINRIMVDTDILAPVIIDYNAISNVYMNGKEQFYGILDVQYYETCSPIMARALAWEFEWRDRSFLARLFSDYEKLAPPELEGADYVSMYSASFPTANLILTRGSTMIHIQLLVNLNPGYDGPAADLELEQEELFREKWAPILAEYFVNGGDADG